MSTSHPTPPVSFAIDTLKITGYLLNTWHPDGRSKAKYFISYGFDPSRPDLLATALLEHPSLLSSFAYAPKVTLHDVRYIFEGPINAPMGLTGRVRSIWQVLPSNLVGRLVTAYPF